MRHPTSGLRLLTLLALLATSSCARHGGGEGAAGGEERAGEAVVTVTLGAVEIRSFASVVVAPGEWRSGGELVLSAPFAGVVQSLTPRVGDRVTGGQELGTLVTRESWAALQGAELMLREARDPAARAEAARAEELARRDLVRVPLTAPQGGVAIRRAVEPGAQVAESGEVLALVPERNIVFEAHVPAVQGATLRIGQSATVTEPGGAPRAAMVQRVLPMASAADQSVLVWLAPRTDGTPPDLERYGSATIVVGPSHHAPAVPDSAVVEDDLTGRRQVATVGADGRIVWTTVELGAADRGWHEVVRPALRAGTPVVIEGQRGLPAGTRVKRAS